MRAEYDSAADAISIVLADNARAVRGVEVHERAVVDLSAEGPVAVQLLYPGDGIDEPLLAAAARFDLDAEAIEAAASSALAAPDRVVNLDVAERGAPA